MNKAYTITTVFILFDLITGFLKALHNRELTSSALREGLFHKASEVLIMIGGGFLDFASDVIELGIDIPIAGGICSYLCITELISILENLGEINPELRMVLKPYLIKLQKLNTDTEKKEGEYNAKESQSSTDN